MIPEGGEGGIVEGSKQTQEHDEQDSRGKAAPRAGMQGQKERGAAPTQTLPRPGTIPVATPGSGGGIGRPKDDEAPREGGRVQDPKSRNTP
jgi:hypothetical protein